MTRSKLLFTSIIIVISFVLVGCSEKPSEELNKEYYEFLSEGTEIWSRVTVAEQEKNENLQIQLLQEHRDFYINSGKLTENNDADKLINEIFDELKKENINRINLELQQVQNDNMNLYGQIGESLKKTLELRKEIEKRLK